MDVKLDMEILISDLDIAGGRLLGYIEYIEYTFETNFLLLPRML